MIACGVAWRWPRSAPAQDWPVAAGEDHHSARARRRRRRVHAADGRGAAEAPRPALHRREPARRRAQHRHPRLRRSRRRTATPSASCPASRSSTTSSPSRTCRSIRRRISSRSSTCSSTPTRWWSNSSLNVKTIPELVALAKAKPGTLSYGTFSFMLAYFMDKLNKKNGIDIVRVPFRSGNEMVNAVMANTTPIVFLGLVQHDRPGQERPVHRARAQRHRALAAVSRHPDARWRRPARTIRRRGSACSRRPARRCRSSTRLHDEVVRIASVPAWRQRNFVERAVEPATGPARRIHQVHRQQPRVRRAGGQGDRHQAAVTARPSGDGHAACVADVVCAGLAAVAAAHRRRRRTIRRGRCGSCFRSRPAAAAMCSPAALADELQKAWHQPVVVENRPGGGQNIGARACAEADARRLHHLRDVERARRLQPISSTRPFPTIRRRTSSRSRTCSSTRSRWSSTARPRSRPSPR